MNSIGKNGKVKSIPLVVVVLTVMSLIGCKNKSEFQYEYYPNGSLRLEKEYKNGLMNGVVTEYYEDGNIKSISHWKDGNAFGVVKRFYNNGQIESIGYLINNESVGKFTFYDTLGRKEEEQFYNELGKIKDLRFYDSLGNELKSLELSIAVANVEDERIKWGEELKAEFRIANRYVDSVFVVVGELNNYDSLVKTGDTLRHNGDYIFKYSTKPELPGDQFFYYKIFQVVDLDSMLSVRESSGKLKCHVEVPPYKIKVNRLSN